MNLELYSVNNDIAPLSSESLFAAFSFISGNIPTTIGRFSKLGTCKSMYMYEPSMRSHANPSVETEHLDLSFLTLKGPIPSELGMCTQLQVLKLGGSLLTGTLPSELAYLSELLTLDVSGNQDMIGTVPSEYAKLSKLETLELGSTKISS